MIVDTHVHYGLSSEGDDHPVEELLATAAGGHVDRIVQVTGSGEGWSNRVSFEGIARFPDQIVGIIGRFDPLAPDLEARLRELKAQPDILGVRLTTRTTGSANGLRDGEFDALFAAAQKLDVAVQIYASFQVPEMLDIARRFPGVRLLIDHMGLRYHDDQDNSDMFRQWPDLIALAKEPNAWIKVSFFPEASRGFDSYPFPTGQRYFQELYESVGAGKLIWGSNYPPVLKACSYRESVDFLREHCAFISPADKEAIFSTTFLSNFGPKRLSSP